MSFLPSSGTILLGNIRSTFRGAGDSNLIKFDQLYATSSNVTYGVFGIPTSGIIKMSDFYSKGVTAKTLPVFMKEATDTIFYKNKTTNALYGRGNYPVSSTQGSYTTYTLIDLGVGKVPKILTGSESEGAGSGFPEQCAILVLTTSNELLGTGNNAYGHLGNGNTANVYGSFVNMTNFGSLSNATIASVTLGYRRGIAADTLGRVHVWGVTDNAGMVTTTPMLFSQGSIIGKAIVQVSAYKHVLALDSTGQVHAWGENLKGQLGNNSVANTDIPVNVSLHGTLVGRKVKQISCTRSSSMAVDFTGKVHCWGDNFYGQCGIEESGNDKITPVETSLHGTLVGEVVTQIACGSGHKMALDSLGRVHVWGNNRLGQIGFGAFTDANIPYRPMQGSLAGKTVVAIHAGDDHSSAIDMNSNLHIWGRLPTDITRTEPILSVPSIVAIPT